MPFADRFLREFEQEMSTTRPVIERVPTERGEWRPHPKSFPVGHLAQLVARMPGWIANGARERSLDLATYPGYSFEPSEALLREFDRNVADASAALRALRDDQLDDEWSLRHGDKVFIRAARRDHLRQSLNHLIHHRGQLTVNLRLLDIPVPCVYGPTADDRGNIGM